MADARVACRWESFSGKLHGFGSRVVRIISAFYGLKRGIISLRSTLEKSFRFDPLSGEGKVFADE